MKQQGTIISFVRSFENSPAIAACQAFSDHSICKFLGVPRPYDYGRGALFCVFGCVVADSD